MNPVRVLVVDDSATMRALLKRSLSTTPDIEVIGEAGDPYDARQKMKMLDPDVVTLDVEMPNMSGLEFLEKIMRLRPTPVIMVSNQTGPGAAATVAALEIGAFDCIPKPSGLAGNTFDGLPALIREAAKAKPIMVARRRPPTGAPAAPVEVASRHTDWPELIGIGSSTGGVEALITVLADFPEDCPPTMIVQHLPASFTGSFSQRLDRLCRARVKEAVDGDPISQGHIYLAPGGWHLTLKKAGGLRCALSKEDPVQGHRPSVDVLFSSIARNFQGRATGVILTGMGRDGAAGLLEMRKKGAHTFGQNEATSLVYGMPRVAFEIGAVERQVPLGKVARSIFE
ncbi:protein-glutamate methylesterase/protein-glutamine glutaminase [Consotaella salsifontis]|uniref:Protein-glutamate methylesterase/protein-glutamine glutaminase n=1 Tax=Consotaella salsifontis TaxID=1365950 RepID=A0A1T4T9N4_9HYPH|nr:chemotaxis response regulator protein-glutamate methylesterase [Consotaella salsifontis]SKA37087.1 two-component system, chemotaxis family, response regulator CheB [Consotaella salsifontis]